MISAHFYQNLDEAEYSVALFMYLVLRGVKPHAISILTATKSQEALVNEILIKKTSWHSSFGLPRNVSYVGESPVHSNDFVIVSLVRSSLPGLAGYPEWLATTFSQAKLGLYVLCNLELFSKVEPLARVLALAADKTHKLAVEMAGQHRQIDSYADLYKVNQELFSQRVTTTAN